jgi:hypothetical protein
LVEMVKAGESQVRAQLLRRFRAAGESASSSGDSPQPRTVGELLRLAESHSEERRRKEAEREAMERARRECEAAAARENYLNGLAQREPDAWAKVDSLIAAKAA